ncbi:unnamed protein product [Linum trigynum]|uniref:Uncharacterized protein n=1 Tax=Linum trigynum TaxID=586398 RepID=A0AAV2ETY2_9ROSI
MFQTIQTPIHKAYSRQTPRPFGLKGKCLAKGPHVLQSPHKDMNHDPSKGPHLLIKLRKAKAVKHKTTLLELDSSTKQ